MYVMAFISKCRKKWFKGHLLRAGETRFSVFSCEELGLRSSYTSVGIVTPGEGDFPRSLVSAFAATLNPKFVDPPQSGLGAHLHHVKHVFVQGVICGIHSVQYEKEEGN